MKLEGSKAGVIKDFLLEGAPVIGSRMSYSDHSDLSTYPILQRLIVNIKVKHRAVLACTMLEEDLSETSG